MDWSDIKPLKEFEAIALVQEYFKNHNLECTKINEKEVKDKKSPDFMIFNNGNLIGYCEMKTPKNELNPITNMYHWDTTFYKLRKFIHKATKQFNDYNPAYEKPRIIVFTSNHPQLNWSSFCHNIAGAVSFNGDVIKDFRQKSFIADSNEDFLLLDMVIWMQISYINPEIYQIKFFLNQKSKFFIESSNICQMLEPNKDDKIKG